MVHTIPAVGRGRGRFRMLTAGLAYVLGGVIAGLAFGTVLGFGGAFIVTRLPGMPITQTKIGLAVIFGLGELGLLPLPRPQRAKQVPSSWRWRWQPELALGLYGAMLGVGVLTRIPFTSLYALLCWVLLSGGPLPGAILMGAFAASRTVPSAVLAWFFPTDDHTCTFARLAMPFQRWVAHINGGILLCFSAWLYLQGIEFPGQ